MRDTYLALGILAAFAVLSRWYIYAQTRYWLSEQVKNSMADRATKVTASAPAPSETGTDHGQSRFARSSFRQGTRAQWLRVNTRIETRR